MRALCVEYFLRIPTDILVIALTIVLIVDTITTFEVIAIDFARILRTWGLDIPSAIYASAPDALLCGWIVVCFNRVIFTFTAFIDNRLR